MFQKVHFKYFRDVMSQVMLRLIATMIIIASVLLVSIAVAQVSTNVPATSKTKKSKFSSNTSTFNKKFHAKVIPLTESANVTKFSRESVTLEYKKFPDQSLKTSITVLEWTELRLKCHSAQSLPKHHSVKWLQYSRWGSIGVHESARVEEKFLDGDHLYFKHMKLKQSACYFCEIYDKHHRILARSDTVAVGFTPNKILTISFILTTLVTFLVAFVINWLDLGRYYCNFLDKPSSSVDS